MGKTLVNESNLSLTALFKQKAQGIDISAALWSVQDVVSPQLDPPAQNRVLRQDIVLTAAVPGWALASSAVVPVISPVSSESRQQTIVQSSPGRSLDAFGNGVAGGRERLQDKEREAKGGPRRGMAASSSKTSKLSLQLEAGTGGASEARRRSGLSQSSLRGNEVAPPILTGGSTQAPPPSSRIDYISFTVKFSDTNLKLILGTCEKHLLRSFIGSRMAIRPITSKLNGYEQGWGAYTRGECLGAVCWGGERTGNTIFVNVPGQVCSLLDYRQFLIIYRLAKRLQVKLTRVDHAVDFYSGECGRVKWLQRQYKKRPRDFWATKGGRPPKKEDYLGENGDSLYIGTKTARSRLRCYEKGIYTGDKNSQWVRIELQMRHDKHSPLPYDVLNPESTFDYVAGKGPFWSKLIGKVGEKRRTLRKPEWESLRAQVLGVVTHLRKQYGGLHQYLVQVLGHDLASQLVADPGQVWGGIRHKPYATDAGFMEMLGSELITQFLKVPVQLEKVAIDDPLPF